MFFFSLKNENVTIDGRIQRDITILVDFKPLQLYEGMKIISWTRTLYRYFVTNIKSSVDIDINDCN